MVRLTSAVLVVVFSALSSPVFSQTCPEKLNGRCTEVEVTCSLDVVPDVSDTAKWESHPQNPISGVLALQNRSASIPAKIWAYRLLDLAQYVQFYAPPTAKQVSESYAAVVICNGTTKSARLALSVKGRWILAKNILTESDRTGDIEFKDVKKDTEGNLVSVTVVLETVEGRKEVAVALK